MDFFYGQDSALMGQKPRNDVDLNIIKGLYRQFKVAADPNLGYIFAPKIPPGAVHETKQPAIIVGMCITLLAILGPTVARLWIKMRSHQTNLGMDDYAIGAAAILSATYPILVIVMVVTAGGGLHTWENTYVDYQRFYYYLATCKVIFYVAVGLIKVSITLFVRRLADRASLVWRIFADVFLGILVSYILVAMFWNTLLCNPPRAAWDKHYAGSLAEPAQCLDMNLNTKVLAYSHICMGVILLSAPIIILWKIKMNKAKKARLFVIWAAGAITVIGGILQQVQTTAGSDSFWSFTTVLQWTCTDLSMGCVTANLPVLDAAIMGGWNSAKTRLYGNRSTPSQTTDWSSNNQRGGTTLRSTAERAPKKEYSESVENIIDKQDGVPMAILRTDEVQLSYESSGHSEPSTSRDKSWYGKNGSHV